MVGVAVTVFVPLTSLRAPTFMRIEMSPLFSQSEPSSCTCSSRMKLPAGGGASHSKTPGAPSAALSRDWTPAGNAESIVMVYVPPPASSAARTRRHTTVAEIVALTQSPSRGTQSPRSPLVMLSEVAPAVYVHPESVLTRY